MIRKRNLSLVEGSLGSDTMEPPGCVVHPDNDDFLESDDELLCSVSDITEHLGRNISMVLDTALSEIRQMVSIRIRVLKMELREKSEEIVALKARLETGQRDTMPGVGGGSIMDLPAELKKHEPASKHNSNNGTEARRTKVLPGVKKENIDAICDYLMKDKNSRGSVDMESSQSSTDKETKTEQQEPPLSLSWSDSGPAQSESETPPEDLFGILPSGSKRMYDYEWITPYSTDLRVMKEPGPDEESVEVDEKEVLREDGSLDKNQDALLNDQQLEISLDHCSPPRESGVSIQNSGGRHETVRSFSTHSFICSLCGTFCPGPAFLEEHIKLIHPDSVEAQALEALQSTASGSGLRDNGTDLNQGPVAPTENGPTADGEKPQRRCFGVKKEIRIEGGYQCGECGRCFNYLGNLRQHQRIHTGEKPFVCPECGERFRHAARLKSHRLVHSGNESPFPCPQCGKGFSVLSGLKRHQRVHTGESPYACPQCGRRFKELGNLYTHQRIHSGATPYCCQQCGRSFRHLGTYKSHRCIPGLLDTSSGLMDPQKPEHSGPMDTNAEHPEHTGLAQST